MLGLVLDGLDFAFGAAEKLASAKSRKNSKVAAIEKERELEINKANNKRFIDISPDLAFEISRISGGKDNYKAKYEEVAEKTLNIINYALYYITDPDAKLIMLSEKEKQLINSVVKIVYPTIGIIFDGVPECRIYDYNAEDAFIWTDYEYLLSIPEIIKVTDNDNFREKVENKYRIVQERSKIDVDSSTTKTVDINSEGYSAPFTIEVPEELIKEEMSKPKQPEGMPGDIFLRLENFFANYIPPDRKYYYDIDSSGNYYLCLPNGVDLNTAKYLIDDGSIMGGTGISILIGYEKPGLFGGYEIDTIFLNIARFPDTFELVLNSPRSVIVNNNVAEYLSMGMLENTRIYRNIDFSNTPFMDLISEGDLSELNRGLSSVMMLNDQDARLRFESYLNPRLFTLVSDNKVKSPLSDIGATSSTVVNGLKFQVDNGNITKTVGGVGTKYQY